MRRPLWIAVAIALIAQSAAQSAQAEVSTWCLWTQLYDLHAVAMRCSAPSPEAKAGYERLRKAVEAAVLRDASLRAGETADSARAEMAQYAAGSRPIDPARCEEPRLKSAVAIFEGLASPQKVSELEAGLANRRDPYEGDCL
jgi:hypothetical protein